MPARPPTNQTVSRYSFHVSLVVGMHLKLQSLVQRAALNGAKTQTTGCDSYLRPTSVRCSIHGSMASLGRPISLHTEPA
jgi:hypothetical protein